MIKTLIKIYMVVLEIASYAVVVITTALGCVLGAVYQGWTLAILGGVLGLAAGFCFDILVVPPIAILFSINDNLKKLQNAAQKKDKKDKSTPTEASSGEDDSSEPPIDEDAIHKARLVKQRESLSKLYNNAERKKPSDNNK